MVIYLTKWLMRFAVLVVTVLCAVEYGIAEVPPDWVSSGIYKTVDGKRIVFNILIPNGKFKWDSTVQHLTCQAVAQSAPNWTDHTIKFSKICIDPTGTGYNTKWVFPSVGTPTAPNHIGTLNNYWLNDPAYSPPTTTGGTRIGLVRNFLYSPPIPPGTNTLYYKTRKVFVYRDHLDRDIANFGSTGPSATVGLKNYPVIGAVPPRCYNHSLNIGDWTYTNPISLKAETMNRWNCFGSVRHANNGNGDGYTVENPCAGMTPPRIYNPPYNWTTIYAGMARGDVILYYSSGPEGPELQHANTMLSTPKTMWGANNRPGLTTYTETCPNCGDTISITHAKWEWATCTPQQYVDALNGTEIPITIIKVYRP